MLNNAVVYFTEADKSWALLVVEKLGGCAMFNRQFGYADALKAKNIYTIGGPALGVPGEVYLAGEHAKDTANTVLDWLK